jgi:hypothetical protein
MIKFVILGLKLKLHAIDIYIYIYILIMFLLALSSTYRMHVNMHIFFREILIGSPVLYKILILKLTLVFNFVN